MKIKVGELHNEIRGFINRLLKPQLLYETNFDYYATYSVTNVMNFKCSKVQFEGLRNNFKKNH